MASHYAVFLDARDSQESDWLFGDYMSRNAFPTTDNQCPQNSGFQFNKPALPVFKLVP